jgi:hypothetical protein
MDAKAGLPTSLLGLAIANTDAAIRGLRDVILEGTRPRIPDIEAEPISLSDGRVCIVFRVPRSPLLPHMVLSDDFRFYARDANGKYRMDVDELRRAFVYTGRSAALHALVHEFRLNAEIEPNVMYFGVPFERAALNEVLRFIADLREDLREMIIELARMIVRYNAVAVAQPVVVSDSGRLQNARQQIAEQAKPLMLDTAERIEQFLREGGL